MAVEISFRIILVKPFPGVLHALQKGYGSNYHVLQAQIAGDADLYFDGTFGVKGTEASGEEPDFSGPLVQGPRGSRFIYIDIGGAARQFGTNWTRRLKVPLAGISWSMVTACTTHKSAILQTTIPGIGKDGGPNCATVKPFPGWHLVNSTV